MPLNTCCLPTQDPPAAWRPGPTPPDAPSRAGPTRPARWKKPLRDWLRPAAPLKQLVYRSYGTGLMSLAALEGLLIATRAKNRANHITGLLIHCRSQYLQCLEGPPAAIDALFQVIRDDIRHDRVVVLQQNAIHRRSFADWSMACTRVGDSAWLQMSTEAWWSQLAREAAASPGLTFMQKAWRAAGEGTWHELLPSLGGVGGAADLADPGAARHGPASRPPVSGA